MVVVCNFSVYWISRAIAGSWRHYDLTLPADELFPLLPWTIAIYFGCFLFWIVNYIMIARLDREHGYRFCSSDLMAKLVCFGFYILLPTTMSRPELSGSGLFYEGMRLLYAIDAPDNLFPSIHCLVSWLCFIGVRGQPRVPWWYRCFSCVFAVAVFFSTLTTKQHVLLDVFAGVLLAEGSYWLAGRAPVRKLFAALFHRLSVFFRQVSA